jgi:hypothetical protein
LQLDQGRYNAPPCLYFIDESGDPGFKFEQGSSPFFTIALVVFEDQEDAIACDQRIGLLHKEIQWQSEFHFKRNPDHVREAFIHAIVPYNFFYYGIVIDKKRQQQLVQQFPGRETFYQYVCGLVFESAKEKLRDATVILDASGNREFGRALAQYLRGKMNTRTMKRVGKLKMQRSHGNNLIQLADYIAGILNRSMQQKKHGKNYRKLISHREISVHVWPPST